MDHLHFSQIVDIAEGRVAPDAAMDRHLAECAACSGHMTWLVRVIDLLRDAADCQAPPAAVAQAKALFRWRRAAPAAPRLIQAMLRFDSRVSAPAFGLRAGGGVERQLLLSADDYDIDLRIVPAGGGWALSGQLLGYSGPNGAAEILGGIDQARTELNEMHEFALPPVRPGRYNLTLSLGQRAVIVPGLDLGG